MFTHSFEHSMNDRSCTELRRDLTSDNSARVVVAKSLCRLDRCGAFDPQLVERPLEEGMELVGKSRARRLSRPGSKERGIDSRTQRLCGDLRQLLRGEHAERVSSNCFVERHFFRRPNGSRLSCRPPDSLPRSYPQAGRRGPPPTRPAEGLGLITGTRQAGGQLQPLVRRRPEARRGEAVVCPW